MAQIGVWSILGDVTSVATLGICGSDFVGLDAQHGLIGVSELSQLMAVLAAARKPTVVRVPSVFDSLFSHALDFGASAVVVPMVYEAGDLEEAIRKSRLQPGGTRSAVSERFGKPYAIRSGEDTQTWHRCIWGMLETRQAVETMETLVKIDGLGGLFVGPTDLALAYDMDPASADGISLVESVGRTLISLGRDNGVSSGIFVHDGRQAVKAAAMGYDVIVVGSDLAWLERSSTEEVLLARGKIS